MPVPKGTRIGGRQKGTPNKANRDLREAARKYTKEAIEKLAHIMREGKSEQAQVIASDKILDRGWGKPAQSVTGEGGEGPVAMKVTLSFD